MTITPNQARELLHETTPAPWKAGHRTLSTGQWYDREILTVEPDVCEDLNDTDQELIIAAPDMAEQIAAMTWEYAVQYQNLDGTWEWSCKEWDNRWQNSYTVQEIRAGRDHQGVETRIVRRLVSTPEVIE